MNSMVVTDVEAKVLSLKRQHQDAWRGYSQWFWAYRFCMEVGELLGALVGLHRGPVDWELTQIASIAMNWLEGISTDAQLEQINSLPSLWERANATAT